MEQAEIKELLTEEFLKTFERELLPGVVHNFANPMNGIMGRAKILQRRWMELNQRIRDVYPEAAGELAVQSDKLTSDLKYLNDDVNSLHKVFSSLADKLITMSSDRTTRFDLSQLLLKELDFSNFYLDFKHQVKKDVDLDPALPKINGPAALFSLCLFSLLRYAHRMMENAPVKELFLRTGHSGNRVFLTIRFPGEKISREKERELEDFVSSSERVAPPEGVESLIFSSLALLSDQGCAYRLTCEEGFHDLTIHIPCEAV